MKSFTVAGDEMTFNPGGAEQAKKRVKRSHVSLLTDQLIIASNITNMQCGFPMYTADCVTLRISCTSRDFAT